MSAILSANRENEQSSPKFFNFIPIKAAILSGLKRVSFALPLSGWGLLFCVVFLFFGLTAKASASGWFSSSWAYRKAITVDHTKVSQASSTTLSNFPVLVSVTDTDLAFGGNGHVASSTGADIVFTDSDGTTLLNYEIETYASSTGQLIAWVKLPTLSPVANHTIYAYFGNASAPVPSAVAAQNTWTDNFTDVYHLAGSTNLSIIDSTGKNNLTASGTVTSVAGMINGTASFPGDAFSFLWNGGVHIGGANSFGLSAWANLATSSAGAYTIGDISYGGADIQIFPVTKRLTFNVYENSASVICPLNNIVTTMVGQWHLYAGIFNGVNNTLQIYVDGQLKQTCPGNGSSANVSPASLLTVGSTFKGATASFNGLIDEFHFASTSLSSDWISTEYNNQSSPSTFYSKGFLEGFTNNPIISSFTANPAIMTLGGSSTLNWQVTGATSITISPGNVSTTTNVSSLVVTPNTATTYTLTATNGNGTATATATVTTPTLGWYNHDSSWPYRKALNINHTKISTVASTTLYNFPVLISVIDNDLKSNINGGHVASSTGVDILFSDSDGVTKLSHEIETYDQTTGQLVAWVSIPILYPTVDHGIYLYFGNASASNQQNPAAVWSGSFANVYHLAGGNGVSVADSMGIYPLTASGTVASVAGMIDGAASFPGAASSFLWNNNAQIAAGATSFGLSAWANLATSVSGTYTIGDLNYGGTDIYLSPSNNNFTFNVYENSASVTCSLNNVVTTMVGQWHLYEGIFNGISNTLQIYVDGQLKQTCAGNGSSANFSYATVFTIGDAYKGGINPFNGFIDEFHIASTSLSSDWISTEYNNQSSPSTFYSKGFLQGFTNNPIIDSFTASPTSIGLSGSSTLSWQTTGATSITISPDSISTSTNVSSLTVAPTMTTTYTLTVTNGSGTATATSTVIFDTISPTIPTNVTIATTTALTATVAWTASQDSVGVAGYDIYRNGSKLATTNSTSYADTNLSVFTSYVYTIDAFDVAGNASPQSNGVSVTFPQVILLHKNMWRIGYLYAGSNTVPIDQFDWGAFTHIIVSSVSPIVVASSSVVNLNINAAYNIMDLTGSAHANGLPIMISLGGASMLAATDSTHLSSFADALINFTESNNFDGIDIDWEGPTINNAQYTNLVNALRSRLDAYNAPVSNTGKGLLSGFFGPIAPAASNFNNLDFVSVSCYDNFDFSFHKVWHNAALYNPGNLAGGYSCQKSLLNFANAGIPKTKLISGVPFYGRIWSGGVDTDGNGPYFPGQLLVTASTNQYIDYDNLLQNVSLWQDAYKKRDIAGGNVPYLSINNGGTSNEFVTYDDADSLTAKWNFVRDNGYAGIATWNMGADYFPSGTTLAQKHPLSEAIKAAAGIPIATGITISGTPIVGSTLTGNYTYTQLDSVAEGVSTFRWLESSASGGIYSAIPGATTNNYALAPGDVGKYIKFEVTPIASIAPTAGQPVMSSATGQIQASPSAGSGTSSGGGVAPPANIPLPASTTTPPTVVPSSPAIPPIASPQSPPPPQYSSARLVNDRGTYYIISSGQKQGISNPGILSSYGFEFKDAQTATVEELNLPSGPLLLPGNGSLVKSKEDSTVYLISNNQRQGFVSGQVFKALGFKFPSVLTITNPELKALPLGDNLTNPNLAHKDGVEVLDKGTIYIIINQIKYPYSSIQVWNSWHIDNDFSKAVPANPADLLLPIGPAVEVRVVE